VGKNEKVFDKIAKESGNKSAFAVKVGVTQNFPCSILTMGNPDLPVLHMGRAVRWWDRLMIRIERDRRVSSRKARAISDFIKEWGIKFLNVK
jgi:hypothetical protein